MSLFCCCRKKMLSVNNHGFTLVEILVVMFIVAIMAGTAAPSVGRIYDNLKFRKQVGNFSSILRYAKLVAVTSGEKVALSLGDDGGCVFEYTGAVEESRNCNIGEEDYFTLEPDEVIFYPEGVATPALLTFERGDRLKRIRVDLLTARPIFE